MFHLILSLFSTLLLQGLLVSYNFNMAAGDTFHIVTSLETPCPGEFSGVPCLTLQQYVSNPSISGNVTLLFETGNHTLGSVFSASSAMKYLLSGDNVNIECISTIAKINFLSILEVYVSGINFWRCNGGINFTNVETVMITNSAVQYSDGYTTRTPPIILSHVGICYIYDSIFSHNRNSYIYFGTGVMRVINSTLYIYNSVFQHNTNSRDYGGVIYTSDITSWPYYIRYTNITLVNSTFMNNIARYYYGGVISVNDHESSSYPLVIGLTIQNCTFMNNLAEHSGGVIYYYGSQEVTIINSTFNNNVVTRSTSQGGAIYSTSPITLTQSNISNNRAQQQGGAIYTTSELRCIESTFTNNSAVDGGAVFISNISFFNSCDFINNTASNYGGGIHITGTNSSLSVLQSSFTRNTAAALGGGAIYSNSRYSNVTISESTFSYNSASYCSVLDMDEFYHFNVSITDSVFTYNMATGRLLGGGVACIRNASIDILRNTFTHNHAALHGGVFHIDESDIFVDESLFMNNSASADGGVFYTYVHPSYYDIRRSEFSYNSAGDDGGVMFIGRFNSRVNINECVFSFNNAIGRGGVAAIIGSSMFLEFNNIFNNTAEYGGIISACNSVVMVMEDALLLTTDSVYSFCTLYDGHIVHHHISPPVDTQLTPSPTTQDTMSSSLEIQPSDSQLEITDQIYSTRYDLEISSSSTKLEETTLLESSISETNSTYISSTPVMAISTSVQLLMSSSKYISASSASSVATPYQQLNIEPSSSDVLGTDKLEQTTVLDSSISETSSIYSTPVMAISTSVQLLMSSSKYISASSASSVATPYQQLNIEPSSSDVLGTDKLEQTTVLESSISETSSIYSTPVMAISTSVQLLMSSKYISASSASSVATPYSQLNIEPSSSEVLGTGKLEQTTVLESSISETSSIYSTPVMAISTSVQLLMSSSKYISASPSSSVATSYSQLNIEPSSSEVLGTGKLEQTTVLQTTVLESFISETSSIYSTPVMAISTSVQLLMSSSKYISASSASSVTTPYQQLNIEPSSSEVLGTGILGTSVISTTYYNVELSQYSVEGAPTQTSQSTSIESQSPLFASPAIYSTTYSTLLETEATTSYSSSALTTSRSVFNTSPELSLPLSETVKSLATMTTEQPPQKSQSHLENLNTLSQVIESTLLKSTDHFVRPTSPAKSSLEPSITMITTDRSNTYPKEEATEQVFVNSDITLKFNVTLALSISCFAIIILIVFFGVIAILIKLHNRDPNKQPNVSLTKNPVYVPNTDENTETPM